MPERPAEKEAFLSRFNDCAHLLGIEVGREQAKDALSSLWEDFVPTANQSTTQNPLYADHGISHPVRLASVCHELLKGIYDPQTCDRDALCSSQTLLLTFAAFLFHDIGMSIAPNNATSLDELAKTQGIRDGHDERSLEFIETTLKMSSRLAGWNSFWQSEDAAPGIPQPQGENALFVLARICKSHGDHPSLWLQEGSLDHYETRLGDKSVKDFKSLWNDNWTIFKKIVYCSATLLSLCDLCELGPNRFLTPQEGILRFLPDNQIYRKFTISHYLAHQVTSLTYSKTSIELRISPCGESSQIDWSYLFPIFSGAAKDLLYWGSRSIFINRMKQFICSSFSGIEIKRSYVKTTTWNESYSRIVDNTDIKKNIFQDVNSMLISGNNTSDLYYLLMSLCRVSLFEHISSGILKKSRSVDREVLLSIARCLREGIALDAIFDVSEVDLDKSVYDTSVIAGDEGEVVNVVGRFLIACALAINICVRRGDYYGIKYISRASEEFGILLNNDLDTLKNNIVLVEVRDEVQGDFRDYADIVGKEAALREHGIIVIFCGRGIVDYDVPLAEDAKSGIQSVRLQPDLTTLERIVANPESKIGPDDSDDIILELGRTATSESAVSTDINAQFFALWRRGVGLKGQLNSLGKADLDSWALSVIAALTIAECVCFDEGSAENPVKADSNEVAGHYEALLEMLGSSRLQPWHVVANTFREYEANGVLIFQRELLDILEYHFDHELHSVPWVRRYVSASVLQARGFFNPASRSLRENSITTGHAQRALSWIDATNSTGLRLRSSSDNRSLIAFGMLLGELIGQSGKARAWCANDFERIFGKQKFDGQIEACIRFQAAYRALRNSDNGFGIFEQATLPKDACLRLGAMEVACRLLERQGDENPNAISFIHNCLQHAQNLPNQSVERSVIFDIFWKYLGRSATPAAARLRNGEFIRGCLEQGYNRWADIFHAGNANDNSDNYSLIDKTALKKWTRFRNNFKVVLEYTPHEYARSFLQSGQNCDRITV